MRANLLDQLRWRCIGPHRGGRVVAVAGDPHDPMVFYFGACAGGVWKTAHGGTYWECVSDGFFRTAAVGALAVAESDPNVVYAGMGETCIRGNVSHGDGVYRSTDAGNSWSHRGLADTRFIGKIRVHPSDPDLVYVAALGHAFGPNEERGVFRSRDGGSNWERILYRGDSAGAVDLSLDPGNPRIMFAAFWETMRTPWSLTSGGAASGIFRSLDGGDSWTEITRNPGLPEGLIGKIGVAVSPARSGRVWALVEAMDGALFRSDDYGLTWTRLSEDVKLRRRAWYYSHLYADPRDADTCWVLNLECLKSIDGGKSFDSVPTGHGDNHDLWIDPHNPLRMIEGNDGGAQVTFNGGDSWSTLLNQPTAQFYHVTADTRTPYRVYGSQQDNSALTIPSRTANDAIGATEWWVPGGGESGYIAVRPDDPNVVFAGAIGSGYGNGLMWRHNHADGTRRNITVWPEVAGMAEGAVALKYRFQWTFPIEISPHDPNTLYVAANRLFRSKTEGSSWECISPDLTRNDASKQVSSGGELTKDNTGAEVYDTIFAFRESPCQAGLFWAGTDDGMV
ncbi:MAG: WD40/YVTN/BNR-like repeat-containing protein, partial [Chloroflexota bacterium]